MDRMDPLPNALDDFDPYQNSYRFVRADGSETPSAGRSRPRPTGPGPGVVLINHYDIDPDNDSMASQIVLVVDESEGTVRILDFPQGIDSRRTWGPNLDEFLWFVTFSCDVHFWTANGTFETPPPGSTSRSARPPSPTPCNSSADAAEGVCRSCAAPRFRHDATRGAGP